MKLKKIAVFLLLLLLAANTATASEEFEIINHKFDDALYKGSYALLIGVYDYENWPNLSYVKEDISAVKEVLTDHGFVVIEVHNPSFEKMRDSFDQFINTYGKDFDNRLLFYYAGHGYTQSKKYGAKMGYLVPADSISPKEDPVNFSNKALDMMQIQQYAKKIDSKHALFLFDSCFAGTIFSQSRGIPSAINEKSEKPVRQFITAGDANEKVPDQSIFRKQLVAALNGEADIVEDGYITASELGEFVHITVTNYSNNAQHPQYGKINDPYLDKGDFVFLMPRSRPAQSQTAPPAQSWSDPSPQKRPIVTEAPEESGFSKLKWQFLTTAAALGSAYLSRQEAQSYNELTKANRDIDQAIPRSSQSEQADLRDEFKRNESEMQSKKRIIQGMDALTLLLLGVEGYLLYDFLSEDAQGKPAEPKQIKIGLRLDPASTGLSFSYRW